MKVKNLIQSIKHYFYVAKDGKWYFGIYEDVPDNHRFISYYSDWYEGHHRVLWIWKICIENHY